jgi:pimeloyl-ACP methyl ester carboxylesterase
VELKCPAEVEATIFDSGFSFDAFAVARRVVTPTLILWARWGDFPRPTYERLAKSMREAQLEDLEAGHLATMEQPERVAEAVARFASGSRR